MQKERESEGEKIRRERDEKSNPPNFVVGVTVREREKSIIFVFPLLIFRCLSVFDSLVCLK